MDENIVGNGIMLMSTDIPRPLFDEYDVMPIAETAKQLTATITPADATNKVVDWSVAWKDANSAWAKGKTVTSYVTVTPTSDGALTANVACLKAFGEQVIVTVAVRGDDSINATATVDYEQRVIGIDLSIKVAWSGGEVPVNWSFTYGNLNPTVDYLSGVKSSLSYQDWALGFCDNSNTTCSITVHYSDYTKNGTWSGVSISVAPSATYISALESAGFTTSVSAGAFVQAGSTNSNSVQCSVSDLILRKFVSSPTGYQNYTQYTTVRNYLKSHSSDVMLQIKLAMIGGTSKDIATVYNVKFSSTSLATLAEGISIGSNIVF